MKLHLISNNMNLMVPFVLYMVLLKVQLSQSITLGRSSSRLTPEKNSIECVDNHPSCSVGVKYGYCTGSKQEIDFMKEHCKKSCNFCGSECRDIKSVDYCYLIKEQNYCHNVRYKSYFEKNCKASCRFCTPSCGVAKIRELSKQPLGIVGGSTATKGYYPWQVAIYHEEKFLCGGSLISEKKILTAAHCFYNRSRNVNEYTVILGEHNRDYYEGTEQEVYLKKIIIHEDYQRIGDLNDIAIMIISENVQSNNYISPICLPEKNAELIPGTVCKLSGWGKLYHIASEEAKILQNVDLPIVSQKECKKKNMRNHRVVTNQMICGGYDDGSTFISGCFGDSGGPLQYEEKGFWKLYGVVTYGSPTCNGLNEYTVFTKVSNYIDWIKEHN